MTVASHSHSTTVIATVAAASIGAGLYLYNHNKSPEASTAMSPSASKCPFAGAAPSAKAYPDAATSYPDAAAVNADGIVTGLTNKRSSEGMGLPAALSQSTIDLVVSRTMERDFSRCGL
jgi:hypothetical protein